MKKNIIIKPLTVGSACIALFCSTPEAKAFSLGSIIGPAVSIIAKPLLEKVKDAAGNLLGKVGGAVGDKIAGWIGIPKPPGMPPVVVAGGQNSFQNLKYSQVFENASIRNEDGIVRINGFSATGADVKNLNVRQRYAVADATVARDGVLTVNNLVLNRTKAAELSVTQDAAARKVFVASGASLTINSAVFGADNIGKAELNQKVLGGVIEARAGNLVLNSFNSGN